MIDKIITIKKYNKFDDLKKSDSDWDFCFSKVNVVYAPNGSGKTSISLMLKSLCDNTSISAKKTFDSEEPTIIKLMGSDKKEFSYNGNRWNRNYKYMEIFNSFYLEDNVYTISIEDKENELNILEMSAQEEARKLRNKLNGKNKSLSIVRKRIKNRKTRLRKENKDFNKDGMYIQLEEKRKKLMKEQKKLFEERNAFLEPLVNNYIANINRYLSSFSNDLKIIDQKIVRLKNSNEIKLIYGIKINNHKIHFNERETAEGHSLKYYLSEGDKNALALSFFLAKMDMVPNPEKYVIVIDDPFTSFDTHRKQTTITQLVRMAHKVGQMFILTHDLHFANDFCNALYDEHPLTLQIRRKGDSYVILREDFKQALLTGVAKDIKTLNDYLKDGDNMSLRDVVRCIRPSIEGIFRLKYFGLVDEKQWLGDFIGMIRNSDDNSPLKRLEVYLPQLEELNDYSKIYHHNNPNYLDVNIDPMELAIHVKNTIDLLYVI